MDLLLRYFYSSYIRLDNIRIRYFVHFKGATENPTERRVESVSRIFILFNLDAQSLFDTALLAIAVFFLFMLMSYLLFDPARKLLKDRKEKD